jgi:hypothetical protein
VREIGADGETPAVTPDRLAAVAQIALTDRPRSVYWFGTIDPAVLLTILRASPAAELMLINPWPEGPTDDLAFHPGQFAGFLGARCRFSGWARIVQGDPASALVRIDKSRVGESAVELAWIQPDTPPALVRQLAGWLAPGGVILSVDEAERDAAVERLRDATGCVTRTLTGTGLIAATSAIQP